MSTGGLAQGAVGILPPGALGVSFFYHLTARLRRIEGDVVWLARPGSASAEALRIGGEMVIAEDRDVRRLSVSSLLRSDWIASYRAGTLPEVVLVCTNPDQLLSLVNACVELLEHLHAAGELLADSLALPRVVLCSNGLYFQRIRQIYLEKLEEATLLGRLPDLWPELMPRIIGRLLRGVTIQTGVREGSGAETIYRPGPKGITRLAGGDEESRWRVCELLTQKGGWFELAPNSSPTRLEFDKAMVNLVANVWGQISCIDEAGRFRARRLGDILSAIDPTEVRTLAGHVFKVGQTVKAYPATEDFDTWWSSVWRNLFEHAGHVPSSVQWIDMKLRVGSLRPELTPTETWILDPLIRYAHAAGLESAARYFEALRRQVLEKLTAASATAS